MNYGAVKKLLRTVGLTVGWDLRYEGRQLYNPDSKEALRKDSSTLL
jgi:hypothetical protein